MHRVHLALALAVASGAAIAQELKPGLWEMKSKMSADGKAMPGAEEMTKQMQAMSPEQRRMVEQMMAQRGVGLGADGHGMRYCMTADMTKAPPASHQGNCTTEYAQRQGDRMPFKFTCTQPASTGEGEVVFHGPTAYSMKMRRTSTDKGQPQVMAMEMQAQRVADDCGDVKPMRR